MRINLIIIATVIVTASSLCGLAQAGCHADSCMMDFWIGSWQLSWDDGNGSTGTGTNEIKKILDGKVISENFTALTGKFSGFNGKSWSVLTPAGTWKQTWVDNSSGYLDLTGRKEGDRVIFQRTASTPDGRSVMQRMVFYDIHATSLTWDWESSADGGSKWNLQWRIFYRRQ